MPPAPRPETVAPKIGAQPAQSGVLHRPALHRLWDMFWSTPTLLLSLTSLFWSGNFVLGRAVHETVPPIALAFWRWTGAFLLVIGFAWPHLRRDLPALLPRWRILLAYAAFGVASFNTLTYIGLQSTTAINALLLQSVMPLAILLCTLLFFRENAAPMQWLGILVSLGGVAAIASHGAPADLLTLSLNPGDAWVLAAVALYAVYSALLRRRPLVHPLSFVAVTFGMGAVIILPFFLWEHVTIARMPATGTALAAVGYVALFPSLLAYLCFNRGVELMGANRAGQFVHLMPFFGSMLAILFLGEAFRAYHAAGITLIGAGIVLATVGSRKA
jgi:drug/metabolite transporter (DMT)-like permease